MNIEIKKLDEKDFQKLGICNWPIWEKEESSFEWMYDEKEQFYLLEGKIKIQNMALCYRFIVYRILRNSSTVMPPEESRLAVERIESISSSFSSPDEILPRRMRISSRVIVPSPSLSAAETIVFLKREGIV